MKSTSYSTTDWTDATTTARAYASAPTVHEVLGSKQLDPSLDPSKFPSRECRKSPTNPEPTPIMIFSDVTGSMGTTAKYMIGAGFISFVQEMLKRKPLTYPQVALGAIGDVTCDEAPLQITQFEVDGRVLEQASKIWPEGGGGRNSFESYNLAWYMAAFRVASDHVGTGRKGFIFTIGDELPPEDLTSKQLEKVFGSGQHQIGRAHV